VPASGQSSEKGSGSVPAAPGADPEPPDPQPESSPDIRIKRMPKMALGF
jgi:hypothetical protein